VAGVSQRQPGIVNFDAEISGDGSTLYFVDGDFRSPSPPKSAEIVIARRRGGEFVRRPRSREVFKRINISNALQYAPPISEDELEIFFTRFNPNTRPLQPEIYRAVPRSIAESFGTPQKVSAITGFVEGPTLGGDARALYYHKREGGRFAIFRVAR
jgi:hypothetical protein